MAIKGRSYVDPIIRRGADDAAPVVAPITAPTVVIDTYPFSSKPQTVVIRGTDDAAPAVDAITAQPVIVVPQRPQQTRAAVVMASAAAEVFVGGTYVVTPQVQPRATPKVGAWIGDPNSAPVVPDPGPVSFVYSQPAKPRHPFGLGRIIVRRGADAPVVGVAPTIDEPTTLALSVHTTTLTLSAHSTTGSLNAHATVNTLGAHATTGTLTAHALTATLNTHSTTNTLSAHSTTNTLKLEDL